VPILTPDNDPEILLSDEDSDELTVEDRSDAIDQLLVKNGLIPQSSNNITSVLNSNGASVEDASKTIAHVMRNGKFDSTKLKAAEIIFDLHGVRDKDGKQQKQTIFQFNIKDSSINMGNVFAPMRSASNQLSNVPPGWEDDFSVSHEPDSSNENEVKPEVKHYGQYFPGF
jgi:hypothetical protein